MKKYILLILTMGLMSCASSTKNRIYQNMLIASATGVVMGQSRDEYKSTYSTMYAGVGAALAALVTLYFEDPDREAEKLRGELKLLSGANEAAKITHQTPATFGAPVPEKYKRLINPGEWRLYEVDRWEEVGESQIQHVDKVIELTPPSLRAE